MDKKLVNFRIEEDRKERWDEAVENNPEYPSLTHLIKIAVKNELRDDEATSAGGEIDVDLTRLENQHDSIQDSLDYIESQVDDVFALVERGVEDDVTEIQTRVLDLIPEPDSVDSMLDDDPDRYDDPEEAARLTGSVPAIVEYLMHPPHEFEMTRIKQAIEVMEENMSGVEMRDATPQEESSDRRLYRLEGWR